MTFALSGEWAAAEQFDAVGDICAPQPWAVAGDPERNFVWYRDRAYAEVGR